MSSYDPGYGARMRQRQRFEAKRVSFFLKRQIENDEWELIDGSHPTLHEARAEGERLVADTDDCYSIWEQVLQHGERRLRELELVRDWDRDCLVVCGGADFAIGVE